MRNYAALVVSAMVVSLTPMAAMAGPVDWMEGMWAGQASQGISNWPMQLTVDGSGGPQMFKVDYPSLGCGGSWSLISARPAGYGGTAQFMETITYGQGKCVTGGAITVGALRAVENRIQLMSFNWSGRQPSGQVDYASGVLNRIGVAPQGPAGPNNGTLQGPNGGRFVPQPQPGQH
jgi:hypothetical protein